MRERRNKEAIQQADREAARARRRQGTDLMRREPTQDVKPTILIVCEGENTERDYFNHFRLTSATVKIQGGRKHPQNVLNYARKLTARQRFDEVWCVFDKDDVSNEAFNQVIQEAEQERFKVAYSNQAFEYWFILHFEDNHGAPMPRSAYHDRINQYINPVAQYDGKGSKKVSATFFDLLDGIDPEKKKYRIQLAIDRAGPNHRRCTDLNKTPAESESCTTVYKLVKRILKYR